MLPDSWKMQRARYIMFLKIVPIFISIPFFNDFYTRLLDDIYARSVE